MTTPALRAAIKAALTDPATTVRGLTVRQPWASAISHLGKTIENRTRSLTYTGLVLIHAGKTPDSAAMREAPTDLPHRGTRGAILAVARITGCHSATTCHGACSPSWAEPDAWHWQLADTVPLAHPVPATGALCLWRPTPELRHQVAAALTQHDQRERFHHP